MHLHKGLGSLCRSFLQVMDQVKKDMEQDDKLRKDFEKAGSCFVFEFFRFFFHGNGHLRLRDPAASTATRS